VLTLLNSKGVRLSVSPDAAHCRECNIARPAHVDSQVVGSGNSLRSTSGRSKSAQMPTAGAIGASLMQLLLDQLALAALVRARQF